MTQEASLLVRAKCAGRFSRWLLFEIFALCDLLRPGNFAAQVDRIGRKTCLP
jgi:hypothetical protein